MFCRLLLTLLLASPLLSETLVIDAVNKKDIREEFIGELSKRGEKVEVISLEESVSKDMCAYKKVILLGSKAVKSAGGFGCMETKFIYTYVLFPTLLNISEKSLLKGVAPFPASKNLLRQGVKGKKNVILYSPYSEYIAEHIAEKLRASNIDISLAGVQKRHQIPAKLIDIAKEKDNLILIPDPLIATVENIKILQSLTKKTDLHVISYFTIPNFDASFIELDNREYARRVLELLKQDLTASVYFIE